MSKFQRMTLDDEFNKPDIFSVRLNRQERTWIDALKKYYNTKSDSTALKNEAFKIFKQLKKLEEIKNK